MAQHDYVLDDNPGAAFRADINSVLQAIASLNSGATAPTTTYPNMWWYDTSTSTLKRRNNANDDWITVGLESASTDGTFAANSDSLVPTQKAAKTYSDTKISKSTTSEIFNVTEKTVLADNDVFLIEDSEASYAKKKVKMSNISPDIGGTWTDISDTSTVTGWASFTAKRIYYTIVGDIAFLVFHIQGTSDSAEAYFSVPAAIEAHNAVSMALGQCVDNGADVTSHPCVSVAAITPTRIRLNKTSGSDSSWTNSGAKTAQGVFIYRIV